LRFGLHCPFLMDVAILRFKKPSAASIAFWF
jgi:hypothetical protein